MIISSTSDGQNADFWSEVESGGRIFCIDYSGTLPTEYILPLSIQVPKINMSTFRLDGIDETIQDLFQNWKPYPEFHESVRNFRLAIESSLIKRLENIRPILSQR